ncbi:MAG: hypothetical protein ACTSQV_03610, partial [Alphaproteobacteria bacterium]
SAGGTAAARVVARTAAAAKVNPANRFIFHSRQSVRIQGFSPVLAKETQPWADSVALRRDIPAPAECCQPFCDMVPQQCLRRCV